MPTTKGLLERLKEGETIICAEGYIFNFERRGYLQAGAFFPEVLLNHPQLIKEQYREFVHAGSDVVQAFTYYAHDVKADLVGRSHKDVEEMNRVALRMAREVADETGTLMCGDMSNISLDSSDPKQAETIRKIYLEQVEWAVTEKADFLVLETIERFEDASIFLDVAKEYANGLPIVVTMMPTIPKERGKVYTIDDVEISECLKRLEALGADVVGVNCGYGPSTMIPLLEDIKKSGIKAPLAALPVTYRTSSKEPHFESLTDPLTGQQSFPLNLDCHLNTRDDITYFGKKCQELGIEYIGLCCGNAAHYTRTLAESIGRRPPASAFSPDMSKHCVYGSDEKLSSHLTNKFKANFTGEKLVSNTF